jgi:hypothetical protein
MYCTTPEALPENDTLHIVTAITNPVLWQSRYRLARAAILDWLKEPNVHVTIVEVAHGERSHCLCDLGCENDRVMHIEVYARTMAWSKECCLNLGIARLPASAKYIGTFDADVHWRVPGWAGQIVHALNLYPVVQPWQTGFDLGPNDEHLQAHQSFAFSNFNGFPVFKKDIAKWNYYGGKYGYPHPGFAWAWTRDTLDGVGGLFELGGMGSGDHHMALALVGLADRSLPEGCGPEYPEALNIWQKRAIRTVNFKVGYVPVTIEHRWHGDKKRRGYISRWACFVKHGFNPLEDLRRNSFGVLEFDGNKPELEREFDLYLRSRQEDANIIA